MNEEEKDAIETLKSDLEFCIYRDEKQEKDYEIILNLIDKLQKENKELQKENKELRDTNKKLYEMGKQRAIQEILNENWVNKDKIRELIKELEESENVGISDIYEIKKEFAIEILKGLL